MVIDRIERIKLLAAWAIVAIHLPLDHRGNCVNFEGSLILLEPFEYSVVQALVDNLGAFHPFAKINNDSNTLGNGMTVIVVRIGRRRKKYFNWWLSVWAVASKCEFLWSGHQHGRLNWIVSSVIWNKCMNVMNEGAWR